MILLLLLIFNKSKAQQKNKKPLAAFLIEVSLGYQVSGGDLENRFGHNYNVGVGSSYKIASNFIFGMDGSFMFGSEVKNAAQVLSPILTKNGLILNTIGNYADFSALERGVFYGGKVGRIFNSLGVNRHSGLSLYLGGGYLWHWIKYSNPGNDIPQLYEEDLKKGYDLLSAGPYSRQSIGYTYLSSKRRINFDVSFDFIQAFTRNLRKYNYGTGSIDTKTRLDLMYGINIKWYLPIYHSINEQAYYY